MPAPTEEIPTPVAETRQYGDPAEVARGDGWAASTDRLESWLLDATHPRQNTRRGAHGFQVEEAKRLAAVLRQAWADGTLTVADLEAR